VTNSGHEEREEREGTVSPASEELAELLASRLASIIGAWPRLEEHASAPTRMDDAYYDEVRRAVGRGAPSLLVGTSTKSLERSLAKLRAVQESESPSSSAPLTKTTSGHPSKYEFSSRKIWKCALLLVLIALSTVVGVWVGVWSWRVGLLFVFLPLLAIEAAGWIPPFNRYLQRIDETLQSLFRHFVTGLLKSLGSDSAELMRKRDAAKKAEDRQQPIGSMPGSAVIGSIPLQGRAFQPRRELMAALSASGPGTAVVTGMRGVGKTQLAAEYARSRVHAGWLVVWLDAADMTSVARGIAQIAAALGADEPFTDLESTAAAVWERLDALGRPCLVVFDNVTDVDSVAQILPANGQIQVIITSTRPEGSALGRVVKVHVFDEAEALAFLAQATGLADADGVQELAAELGFFPLALAQAAAVISAQHLNYPTYLARLRTVPVGEILKRALKEPYSHDAAEAIVLALDAVAAA
jgi:hypothetical protein